MGLCIVACYVAREHKKVQAEPSSDPTESSRQSQCFYEIGAATGGNFVGLMMHRPMGPGMGEGGGFRPTGHRGVRVVPPGVDRGSGGLEFEIAQSSTGDDAATIYFSE